MSNIDENIDNLFISETGMYFLGIDADPDEASKAMTFRKNTALLLKAIRIKFDYLNIGAGEFFSFLCNATEGEVKEKIETFLEVVL